MEPDELLARYLFSEKWFSMKNNRVKPKALMPNPQLRTSMFRIRGLQEEETWALGHGAAQGRTLYGSANVEVRVVEEAGLRLEPDPEPSRHADIVGWPSDKDSQQSLALELAEGARLVLCQS